jgi:hypothetical protein
MEHQDRFNLEQALRAWGEDCASRPGISLDNARELESDLRERVADFLKQGLNEREAFSQAVRQVGSPGELAREFARANPLVVWRERLFWIVAAGFGAEVWALLTDGSISWFVNTLSVLLPVPGSAWFMVGRHLPLLAMAVLLATGRLENVAARIRFFGRQHLAFAGCGLVAVGVLVRLFGPRSFAAPVPLWAQVMLLSLWPLVLLFLGVSLFRPVRALESAMSAFASVRLPRVVWRDRVFWMALGALVVGIWQTVSWVGMKALFYTGDMDRPFRVGTVVFLSYFLVIELSPLIVLGLLLRQRMRAGKDVSGEKLVRRRALFAFIPTAVCAWTAVHFCSEYFWQTGLNISWDSIVANYLINFRWLWPAGLALLILWLAPKGDAKLRSSLATIEAHM